MACRLNVLHATKGALMEVHWQRSRNHFWVFITIYVTNFNLSLLFYKLSNIKMRPAFYKHTVLLIFTIIITFEFDFTKHGTPCGRWISKRLIWKGINNSSNLNRKRVSIWARLFRCAEVDICTNFTLRLNLWEITK